MCSSSVRLFSFSIIILCETIITTSRVVTNLSKEPVKFFDVNNNNEFYFFILFKNENEGKIHDVTHKTKHTQLSESIMLWRKKKVYTNRVWQRATQWESVTKNTKREPYGNDEGMSECEQTHSIRIDIKHTLATRTHT